MTIKELTELVAKMIGYEEQCYSTSADEGAKMLVDDSRCCNGLCDYH